MSVLGSDNDVILEFVAAFGIPIDQLRQVTIHIAADSLVTIDAQYLPSADQMRKGAEIIRKRWKMEIKERGESWC